MTNDRYQKLHTLHFAEEIKKRHGKKNLKCVILGNFGAMNLGDEAILAGEIQELRKLSNLTITAVGRYPKEITRLHKVHALSLYELNRVRREIRKSDFVIVGGGGLINKVERSLIGFFYQLYMIFLFFLLPRIYRKKSYIIGIGIYNNAHPFIVNLALPFFKAASLLTVRDQHSQDFLKHKNVHAGYYKDNSFLMDLTPLATVQKDPFFQKNYRKGRLHIGLSLIKPDNNGVEKRLIKEIIEFIGVYKNKADFWIYATDCNPEYFNDEKFSMKLIKEAQRKLKGEIIFHVVPNDMSPQAYFASFKLMQFIIAMRFHGAIFAYRNNVPFAGISYDKKCESFITAIGKTPLKIDKVTSEEIQKYVL